MTSPSTGLAAHRGSSYSLIGHDANYWRDFRYPWPAAAAGARGTCRLRQVNPRCYIFGLPAPLVCLYPRFCVACVLAQNCASIISHRERRIASLWLLRWQDRRPNPRMPRVMTRALRTTTKGRGDGRGESAHRKVAQQPISSGVLTECRPQRGE
jgi:hypothetical protein